MSRRKAQPTAIINPEFSILISGGDLRSGIDYSQQIEDAKDGLIALQGLISRLQTAQSRSNSPETKKTSRSRKSSTQVITGITLEKLLADTPSVAEAVHVG